MAMVSVCRNASTISQMTKLLSFAVVKGVPAFLPALPSRRRMTRKKFLSVEYSYLAFQWQDFVWVLGKLKDESGSWGLLAEMEKRTKATPIPFPEDISELKDMDYCKMRVVGHFDHSRELYMRPRSPVETQDGGAGLMSAGRVKTGAYVITPFVLADSKQRILVNRGWVPREQINPATREKGQVQGEVDLVGVFRLNEKRKPFGGKNDIANNFWMNRDVDAMSQELNTLPVFLDADAESTIPGGPIGGQTRVSLRNEHLQYLLTWYTLCGITSYMWYLSFIVKR